MKNKLDATNFCKLIDLFGFEAAKDTLKDVNEGKIKESTIEKYIYRDETKEQYRQRVRRELYDD